MRSGSHFPVKSPLRQIDRASRVGQLEGFDDVEADIPNVRRFQREGHWGTEARTCEVQEVLDHAFHAVEASTNPLSRIAMGILIVSHEELQLRSRDSRAQRVAKIVTEDAQEEVPAALGALIEPTDCFRQRLIHCLVEANELVQVPSVALAHLQRPVADHARTQASVLGDELVQSETGAETIRGVGLGGLGHVRTMRSKVTSRLLHPMLVGLNRSNVGGDRSKNRFGAITKLLAAEHTGRR